MRNWLRRIWNEVGIYKVRHPLINGMWFVGGRQFQSRQPTAEETFLMSLDLRDKVVYDIGANVGIMTLFFARSVGDGGTVVAFEPHPYSFHRLNRNIKVNRLRNVRALHVAVGEQKAQLELFQPSRHLSAATFDREKAVRMQEGNIIVHTVEVDTLDSLIACYQLPAPDMIKVDVEGFEVNVLLGASETIRRFKPAWFIEIHRDASESPTTQQVVKLLAPYGYQFFHVENQAGITEDIADTIRGGHLFATPSREDTA